MVVDAVLLGAVVPEHLVRVRVKARVRLRVRARVRVRVRVKVRVRVRVVAEHHAVLVGELLVLPRQLAREAPA